MLQSGLIMDGAYCWHQLHLVLSRRKAITWVPSSWSPDNTQQVTVTFMWANHRELSYTIVIIGIMLMISTAYIYGNVNTCIKFQTELFSHDISMIDHSYWGFTASMPSWFVLEPTGHPSAGKQINSVLVLLSFVNRDHSHKK